MVKATSASAFALFLLGASLRASTVAGDEPYVAWEGFLRAFSLGPYRGRGRDHAEDIVVHYPDGHTTKGIPDHVKELKFMWTFAPDNRITEHPVRFGTADGKWTAVAGFLDGTFTKPMVLPNSTVIQPTGKAYHLPMATLGHWNKQGTMSEEFLFWDNSTLMQQIGVGK